MSSADVEPRTEDQAVAADPAARRRSRPVLAAVAALAAFVALVCWGLSSPPGSSPDEQFHMASVWCGQGIDETHCVGYPGDNAARVIPQELTVAQCFTGDPTKSADCRVPGYADHMTPDFPGFVGNWNDGGYPPVYYFVMNTFALESYDASVFWIRTINAGLAVLVVGGLALLLPPRLRRVPLTAYLATSVPLVLFLGGSVNPSGWANLSIGTLWLALYAAYDVGGARRRWLWAFVLLVTVMGAGARADAALFAVVGIALALGMRMGELRRQWPTTLVGATAAVLALGLFVTSGHASAVAQGIPGYEPVPASDAQLVLANTLQVPLLWLGNLGMGPLGSLGWFDTPLPFVVGFASVLVWGWVLVYGWRRTWWQKTVAVLLTIAAMTAYPLIVLQQSHAFVGTAVQPRYLLPLLLMLVGISLLPPADATVREAWSPFQVAMLLAALVVAQSVALFFNMLRYVKGLPPGQVDWLTGDGWWWDGAPFSPTAVWVVGSLAFAVLASWVLGQWLRPVVARQDLIAGDG